MIHMDADTRSINRLVTVSLLILFVLVLFYFAIDRLGLVSLVSDMERLKGAMTAASGLGVPIINGLMTLAIVLNPIPSAPIALVSGALYGHTWGTIYIIIGAQIGAMAAFLIARKGGRELVIRLFGNTRVPVWIGSQNSLTILVFLSRLIPFISFDLVSYAAGLTSLRLWRFSVATLFGLMPASFLLAHFGSEVSTEDLNDVITYGLLVGLIVLLPMLLGLIGLLKKSPLFKNYE